MRSITIIVVLLVLGISGRPGGGIDLVESDVQKYVDEYERDLGVEIDFPVTFSGELAPRVLAWCHLGTPHVEINLLTWSRLNRFQQRWLVYHELTHCKFRVGHYPFPHIHIMNSFLIRDVSERQWKQLVDGLKYWISVNQNEL